jgi:Flp pilus assembly pilin Flp
MDLILKFSADEAGAPAVEYALLVACIALIVATGISSLGQALKNSIADSKTKMFGGS